MTRLSAALLTISALLAGCATVRTTPYRERTASTSDALRGITYRLPMVQYDLTIVRTLAECPGGTIKDKPTSLKFSTDVSAQTRYVPGEAYTLDPRLTGLLKTSSLEVNYYPNGTLKSIGVAAEDRTGQVVENAAKLAAAGLMLAAGVPPVAVATATGPSVLPQTSGQLNALLSNSKNLQVRTVGTTQVVCTDQAKTDLQALVKADEEIKGETKALVKANGEMKDLAEEIALKLKKPGDPNVQRRWAAILQEQRRSNRAIETAKENKAKALEPLSVKETLRWPEHFADARQSTDLPLGPAAQEKLEKLLTMGKATQVVAAPGTDDSAILKDLKSLSSDKSVFLFGGTPGTAPAGLPELATRLANTAGQPAPAVPEACLDGSTITACLKHHLDLLLAVHMEWPLAGDCAPHPSSDSECVHLRQASGEGEDNAREKSGSVQHARNVAYDEGIFIREPAQGKLLVCRKALAKNQGGQLCDPGDDLAELEPTNFPQLGQLRFLKFKVPVFQAKDMGVFLTADGRLERYYLKSTKAALEAATASAAGAATTISDAFEKRETERQSDLEYQQNEKGKALAAQIAELENAEKLKKLQTPPSDDPLMPLRDAAAENEAYIAQLKSQLVRQQLQAALDSQDDAAMRALLALLKGE